MAIVTATYPSNLIKVVYRGFVASLSFTGPTNLTKVISRAFTAVISFTTAFLRPATRVASFVASLISQGNMTNIHWYTGVFKQKSVGTLRAISRAINNMITQGPPN